MVIEAGVVGNEIFHVISACDGALNTWSQAAADTVPPLNITALL